MFWILLGVLFALLFYWKCVRPVSHFKRIGVVQPENSLPLFGDTFALFFRKTSWPELIKYFYNVAPNSRYCGVYQTSLVPTLVLRDLDLIKQMTIKDFDHFTDHGDLINPELDRLWARNLFSLKGQVWRDMRATVSPSFTSSKLKLMFGLMENVATNLVDYLKEKNAEGVVEFQTKDLYSRFSSDVIISTALGVSVDSLRNPDNEFYKIGKELSSLGILAILKTFFAGIFPRFSKLINLKMFDEKFYYFLKRVIEANIKEREEKGIKRPDMIQLMMDARKDPSANGTDSTSDHTAQESNGTQKTLRQRLEVTIDDMISQAMIFFVAGFDNPSHILSLACHELALNPEVQQKLRHEIHDTLEKHQGKITYEILLEMKYLEMVVSETLRKYPVNVVLDRVCTKPYTIEPKLPGEVPVHIKLGEVFFISAIGLHYDPKYYPDPEKFDPERFSAENIQNIEVGSYIPFGIGPRNCIGSRFALLEIKIALFHVIANFEIVRVKKTNVPIKFSRKVINLTEDDGFWLGIKPVSKEMVDTTS